MAKNDGRNNFMKAIEQLPSRRMVVQGVVAELGTIKDGGVLPDSYPDGSESDDDFLKISGAELNDGDRVLLIWTDAEENKKKKKVEGDENDAG